MKKKDTFDPDLEVHLQELSELLESNMANKKAHVDKLIKYYPNHSSEILELYGGWLELSLLQVPEIKPEMDVAFYKMLNDQSIVLPLGNLSIKNNTRWLNTKWLAIAATFVIGLAFGNWLDFGTVPPNAPNSPAIESSMISFASVDQTPAASDRIRVINEIRDREDLDLKILSALNKVILNDPNVNVRLSAIGTMVRFSDIPEARKYLIEAIPYQQSSIVQLELADVMIALEETESVDQWNELLGSEYLENDVRLHLKENLKKIL